MHFAELEQPTPGRRLELAFGTAPVTIQVPKLDTVDCEAKVLLADEQSAPLPCPVFRSMRQFVLPRPRREARGTRRVVECVRGVSGHHGPGIPTAGGDRATRVAKPHLRDALLGRRLPLADGPRHSWEVLPLWGRGWLSTGARRHLGVDPTVPGLDHPLRHRLPRGVRTTFPHRGRNFSSVDRKRALPTPRFDRNSPLPQRAVRTRWLLTNGMGYVLSSFELGSVRHDRLLTAR